MSGEQAVSFRSSEIPFDEHNTTLAIRLRLLTPLREKWTLRVPAYGFPNGEDVEESLPGALSTVSIESEDLTSVVLQGYDGDDGLLLYKYDYKNDFEELKEIVIVLHRDEDPEDNMKVRFEHNLIVNRKRVCNVKQSILKSSEMIRVCSSANYDIQLFSEMEEGTSGHFLFEVTDLGNEVY